MQKNAQNFMIFTLAIGMAQEWSKMDNLEMQVLMITV